MCTKSVVPLYKTLQSKVQQGKYKLCVIVHSHKVRKKHRKDLVQRIFLHTFAPVILKTIFFTLNSLIPIEDLERLPVKAIAFLFMLFPQTFAKQKLPTFTFLLVLFVANRHHSSTRSKTQNVEQYSYEGCSAILFID